MIDYTIKTYWDRNKQRLRLEKVVRENTLRWLYKNSLGRFITSNFFSRTLFNRLYGWVCNSSLSKKKIAPFIKRYNIDIHEFEECSYGSFNEFFTRKLKSGMRTFDAMPDVLPAFAEGKCLAWDSLAQQQTLPVKGLSINAQLLLGQERLAAFFQNGPCIIIRLSPADYHRFHFCDSGRIIEYYQIPGKLHSVHTLALSVKKDIFYTNKRDITIQKTENFGLIAYVEIGAMTVGKTIQHYAPGCVVTRGMEKGYFSCGGSTIVIFGEEKAWRPDRELTHYTNKGLECFVTLGTLIGYKT